MTTELLDTEVVASLTIDASDLAKHLTAMSGVVRQSPLIPIHQCVRMHIENGELILVAGDERLSACRTMWLPIGFHTGEFAFCVNHRELSALMASYKGTVVIEQLSTGVRLRTQTGEAELETEPFGDYPPPPTATDAPTTTLSWPEAQALSGALARVRLFAKKDSDQDYGSMGYVWVYQFTSGKTHACAFNSNHVAVEQLDIDLPFRLGVHASQTAIVRAALLENEGPVTIQHTGTWIRFTAKGQSLSIRESGATPVRHEAVGDNCAKHEFPYAGLLPSADLTGMIKRIKALTMKADEQLKIVQTVNWNGSTAFSYAQAETRRRVDETIGDEYGTDVLDQPLKINIDALADGLTVIDSPNVVLSCAADPSVPMKLTADDNEERTVYITRTN